MLVEILVHTSKGPPSASSLDLVSPSHWWPSASSCAFYFALQDKSFLRRKSWECDFVPTSINDVRCRNFGVCWCETQTIKFETFYEISTRTQSYRKGAFSTLWWFSLTSQASSAHPNFVFVCTDVSANLITLSLADCLTVCFYDYDYLWEGSMKFLRRKICQYFNFNQCSDYGNLNLWDPK